jgi:retron-type reverse transcriptase
VKLAATRWKNALQQIFSPAELNVAWNLERQRLKSSCYGIDRVSGKQFDAERSWRIPSIKERRLNPHFTPSPLLAIAKPKEAGGHRIICVPTIEDRLIQFNILYKIREPLKKKGLLNDISYGLVAQSNRTVQDARNRASILRENGQWVYKTDIQKFFDKIPRNQLQTQIQRLVPYSTLHALLSAFASVEIGDGFASNWKEVTEQAGIVPGLGVRQGMPLSPYFAGILLRDLDREIEKRGFPAIRYVDDIIGFFSSRKECEEFDTFLRDELGKLSLSLGVIGEEKSKTRIYEPNEAANFVGMEMQFREDGKCHLRVSERTLQTIEARFAEMMSLEKLLQKQITLPFLGARLEAMVRGYVAAYHGAHNMSELKQRLRNCSAPIVQAVLEDIFGPTVKSLNQKERKFLGLE